MDENAMNGKKLKIAAQIISNAGGQIEALVAVLKDKLIEALTDEKRKLRAKIGNEDWVDSEGGWIFKSYLWNIAWLEGRKQKPSWHIAIQVVLFDEDEALIPGWEPSLYIMYCKGESGFDLDEESFWLSSVIEDGCKLYGERLWCWESGWGFVLPLVKLSSEENLIQEIVDPVKKLLENPDHFDTVLSKSVAFRFTQGRDGIKIINE